MSLPRALRTCLPLLGLSLMAAAHAQAPAAPEAPASAPASVASAASASAASAASALPGPDPQRCALHTDRASQADMQAATLQAQRGELKPLAALLDQAIQQWTLAVADCDGRARERARRNLADTQKLRSGVSEQQDSGELCDTTQKNAAALQDLARQAISDRRWTEAAVLFRKAEGQWDLATERCSGSQKQVATQRREQSEVDGHNAEHCAPLFDRAREFTQRFRSGAAAMAPTDRQRQSQVAETLWRDAVGQCRGQAQDLARTHAETLARERGTAWVANRPTATATPPIAAASAPAAGSNATIAATATSSTASAGTAATPAPAVAKASATVAAVLAAATGAPPPNPERTEQTLADGTRVSGQLAWEEAYRGYTGRGQIQWPNGDLYDGDLLRGKRHGQGEFRWPNGQTYAGSWVDDVPQGQGRMRFANGNQFEGSVVAGVPQGEGEMRYASGDRYSGTLRNGQPDGRGTYTWVSGQRCQCTWVQGEANGPGQLRFANGNVYDGPLLAGQPHGTGKLQYAGGETYEGQFEQGTIQGQGRYTWTSGDAYDGAWVAGRKHGQGVLTWAHGDSWEGLYRDDERTEQGTLKRKAP